MTPWKGTSFSRPRNCRSFSILPRTVCRRFVSVGRFLGKKNKCITKKRTKRYAMQGLPCAGVVCQGVHRNHCAAVGDILSDNRTRHGEREGAARWGAALGSCSRSPSQRRLTVRTCWTQGTYTFFNASGSAFKNHYRWVPVIVSLSESAVPARGSSHGQIAGCLGPAAGARPTSTPIKVSAPDVLRKT